jgi:hypothetical protein
VYHAWLDELNQDIGGFTKYPLLDAILVQNFIVRMLHVIIGIGYAMDGGVIEWLKSSIEF